MFLERVRPEVRAGDRAGVVADTVFPGVPTSGASLGSICVTGLLCASCSRPAKSIDQSAAFHTVRPSTAGTSVLSTCASRFGRWSKLYAHSYCGIVVLPVGMPP